MSDRAEAMREACAKYVEETDDTNLWDEHHESRAAFAEGIRSLPLPPGHPRTSPVPHTDHVSRAEVLALVEHHAPHITGLARAILSMPSAPDPERTGAAPDVWRASDVLRDLDEDPVAAILSALPTLSAADVLRVREAANGIQVARAWFVVSDDDDGYDYWRRMPDPWRYGQSLAEVWFYAEWSARVGNEQTEHPTPEAARAWCDERLRERGVRLMGEEG